MKITFVTTDWDNCVAGPNSWIKRTASNLRNIGIDVSILVFAFGRHNNPTAEYFLNNGFKCSIYKAGSLFTIPSGIRWILQEVKKNKPDIFIPSMGTVGFYAAKWVKSAGIPSINILHSDDVYHRGVLKQFVFGEPTFSFSALVCVSKFLSDYVLSQNPTNTIVKHIPYGTPVPKLTVSPPKNKFRLVYVGRLVEEQKRVSEVARALCLATLKYPNCEAIMYGEGDAKPNVQAILEQHSGHQVTLFGRVESEKIQEQLLQAHALVLLSDYEGLPIAVLEAMACGVVPICLNIRSGVSELIKDGENGFLVSDREDSFLKAVGEIQSDTSLWQRLSQNAISTIKKSYSDEYCTTEWKNFFNDIISSKRESAQISIPFQLKLPSLNNDIEHPNHRKSAFELIINKVYTKFYSALEWRVKALLSQRNIKPV